ncbi:NAD(P)H-hydrate dehydratase [Helicobacter anatolicus]|uniref:NAD(P)H-hydrate dehydratase n=1 Tax=Helicobacter anatolicus TaxID=2905874 RepID=UPI001E332607|nr:NAD(P)H-hydrate dehydratase [Helicobacter anatolicus]MCE3039079.1 NAD(P)H-hydrate dehydratase [Helicobacter anatolicus]
MLNLYRDKKTLDSRCTTHFKIDSMILMENAGISLRLLVEELAPLGSVVLIVCGGGDNGGDGYVLARQLMEKYCVKVFLAKEPKSELCKLQYQRILALGVEVVTEFFPCDVLVDCFIGSGLKLPLDSKTKEIILKMSKIGHIKIACDLPSGITLDGNGEVVFQADYTMAMGGLNYALFSDYAKDYVGEIKIGNLGLCSLDYAQDSCIKLLEKSDWQLPFRKKQNTHKGDYGFLSVYAGNKNGAGNLSALAGLRIGAGCVGVFGNLYPYSLELIYEKEISIKTSAFCIGMGMGEEIPKNFIEFLAKNTDIPCVLDADILRKKEVVEILKNHSHLVLTPHCGEFLSLWENCGFIPLKKQEFLENKLQYLMEFCAKYPHVVVVLKGANTLIAQSQQIYVNAFGNVSLAKAGSGDVLCGIIGGLLAQGIDALQAAIQGSLTHSFCAWEFKKYNYALTPLDLIENIKKLH